MLSQISYATLPPCWRTEYLLNDYYEYSNWPNWPSKVIMGIPFYLLYLYPTLNKIYIILSYLIIVGVS